MNKKLRIVLAQINLTVGDIQGNLSKMQQAALKARDDLKANLIVFPELSMTGYLHEDLVLRPDFLQEASNALNEFKKTVHGIYCIVGHPLPTKKGLFNAATLFYNGKIVGRSLKYFLPNYGVFDESRYYISGGNPAVLNIEGIPVGILICEDVWHEKPILKAKEKGAQLIISLNASPFEITKFEAREQNIRARAQATHLPILYVNHLCGQDDLVFDGGSMVLDAHGKIQQHAGFFNEILFPVDIEISNDEAHITPVPFIIPSQEERIYQALVLSVRDYVNKNGFKGALIGISGGIDSALTLAIAVDALGKENVTGIIMPSRFSAEMSQKDALQLMQNLCVQSEIISIEPTFQAFLTSLKVEGTSGITPENIQARCRGVILMALSNHTGKIVLTTGNRSELAEGYATLYGDMAGGFNVLKDVPKTLVYKLADLRNQISSVIPHNIIARPPTAELAPNQKDEDSLPPYPVLDAILELYLNQEKSLEEIVAAGFEKEVVTAVIERIYESEYKRRQAPIGPRINHKAFGRDRRYPITSGFPGFIK